jgi:HEAT repeat protein
MCRVEETANSVDSISWRAYREAEGLTDLSMIPELVAFLNSSPAKGHRQAAYFVLGKLGKNTQNPDCVASLLSCVPGEPDKYALATLLGGLADIRKPIHVDLAPVYRLLDDKRWLVRHSAIQALNNAESPEAEDRLLSVLATSADADDLIYCHATLNRIGTVKSLSRLREGLKSRKRDVKLSAQMAIEAIQARAAALSGVGAEPLTKQG